ncbi:MAG: T9SS type A sorting domain-containing protein [Fidelibacterota bacterium]
MALTLGLAKQPPPFDADAFLESLYNPATHSSRDLTMDLLWLAHYGSTLPPGTRTRLGNQGIRLTPERKRLSRPEADGLDQFLDTQFFRIHYTLSGTHAVNTTDNDGNSIPDFVDDIAVVFDSVYTAFTQDMEYTPPPGDSWVTTDNGGNGNYDIYLRSIYPGYYGYTQSEYFAQGTGDNEHTTDITENNALTSYLALRNDYSGFPDDPSRNIRVTAAHEFFHAIQFGYDGYEEIWLLEATAVWMEEVMYDQINDCYQYMPSWFQSPQTSLDFYGTHMYGSYIFFRYLEENWNGMSSVRAIFESSVDYNSQNGRYDFRAINDGLAQYNLDFKGIFNGMVIANRILTSSASAGRYRYREAEAYPIDGPKIWKTIHQDSALTSHNLRRYGSEYINLEIDHPVQVTVSSSTNNRNVIALGIVKSSPNSYAIYSGRDFILPSATYAEWISLALAAQDTLNDDYGYTLSLQRTEKPPEAVTVLLPRPNPATAETGIFFTIQMNDLRKVRAYIADVTGRRIAPLYQGTTTAQIELNWKGIMGTQQAAPSGVYFFVVETPEKTVMKRFTWLR